MRDNKLLYKTKPQVFNPDGAGKDNDQGEKCELGGARLVAEDGVGKSDEERGERSEDDEGVDIGVAEEVGVGEDGEEED